MAGHDEVPRGSIDSTLPQMSDVVPADGSLFRPVHARQQSHPNVFSDDFSIDSIDAPLFSNHERNLSFSSLDSVSTIEPRHYDTSKSGIEGDTRTNLLNQQQSRRSIISLQQPEEPLTLGRTVSHDSEASFTPNEEATDDPFADQPTSSLMNTARPSSIRKGINSLNRQSTVSTISARSGYAPVPRAMSPYRGATGPSHPYGMYPQIGVSRSASIATMSTMRQVDGPLIGQTAPQHPYGMYRQNIDYEEDLGDQPIPVGFPAHPIQPSQGSSPQADEVGDIVGPDGHLEQLPPYSRYPDGIIRPTPGRGPASIASVRRGRFERYQDEPQQTRSDASSGTLINVDSSEPLHPSSGQSDGSSTLVMSLDEKLRQKGRQKCFGVPIWFVVVLSMAMVICALLGGVIGGVLGERAATRRAQAIAAAHSSQSATVVTVTYTSDVSPYTATPTGVAALPTGNYQVPWTVTNVSKFCVGTSNQMQAWSCQVMDPLAIQVQGSVMSGSLTVQQPTIQGNQLNYGAQLPFDINPLTQNLNIMLDKEDPELGPALFFQTMFNKLVIVQDSANLQKRAIGERDSSGNGFEQGQNANTNPAKPWFCWWNQTQIETFIYINQTQGASSSSSSSTTGPTTQPASTTTGSTPASTAGGSHKRDLDLRDVITGNYPRKVKIKENRVNPSAPQAYCQQMQVNGDNSITPISGQRFNINETVPEQHSGQTPCYCEWVT